MSHGKENLPPGYELWADQDGDWWLQPPSNVTLFSVPGESLLIGTCTKAQAYEDAHAAIAAL